MAQIYTQQIAAERTPLEPETNRLQWAESARKEGVQGIDTAANGFADLAKKQAAIDKADEEKKKTEEKVLAQRQAKASDAADELVKKQLIQIHKNGKEMFPKDENSYQQFVSKATAPIWAAVPEDRQARLRAELSIEASGYFYQVKKGQIDRAERTYIENRNQTAQEQVDGLINSAGILMEDNNNLTLQEQAEHLRAISDRKIQINALYRDMRRTDQNGNFVYDDATRAAIDDLYRNDGYYAVIDYAGKNIASNRQGVVDLRDEMLADPAGFQKRYGLDNKKFGETLSAVNGIVEGRTTLADLKKAEGLKVAADMYEKRLSVDVNGNITGEGANNINALGAAQLAYTTALENGAYTSQTDKEEASQSLSRISVALNKAIEKNVGAEGQRNGMMRFFGVGKQNAGEVLVSSVNDHIRDIAEIMGVKPDELNNVKAEWYSKAYAQAKSLGLDLTVKGNKNVNTTMREIVNGLLVDYTEANVGTLTMTDEEKKNPDLAKNAVYRVFVQKKQRDDQALLDSILNGKGTKLFDENGVIPAGSNNATVKQQEVEDFLKTAGVRVNRG